MKQLLLFLAFLPMFLGNVNGQKNTAVNWYGKDNILKVGIGKDYLQKVWFVDFRGVGELQMAFKDSAVSITGDTLKLLTKMMHLLFESYMLQFDTSTRVISNIQSPNELSYGLTAQYSGNKLQEDILANPIIKNKVKVKKFKTPASDSMLVRGKGGYIQRVVGIQINDSSYRVCTVRDNITGKIYLSIYNPLFLLRQPLLIMGKAK